jgi:hypothetical protein
MDGVEVGSDTGTFGQDLPKQFIYVALRSLVRMAQFIGALFFYSSDLKSRRFDSRQALLLFASKRRILKENYG